MWRILVKNLRNYFGHRLALVLYLAVPVILAVLFDAALSGAEKPAASTLVIVDHDAGDSPDPSAPRLGAALTRGLGQAVDGLELRLRTSTDAAAARALVDHGHATAALIVPPSFTERAVGGAPEPVELYLDERRVVGAPVTRAAVRAVVEAVIDAARAAEPIAAGYLEPALPTRVEWVAGSRPPRPRLVMATTLLSFSVLFMVLNGPRAARLLLEEERQGTLARLRTLPISLLRVLLGHGLFVACVLSLQFGVLLLVGWLGFGIDWGDPAALAAMGLITVFCIAGLALVAAALARDPAQLGVIGSVLVVLASPLGGFTAGAETTALEPLSYGAPNYWARVGLMRVLDGGGLEEVLVPVAVLAGFTAVFLGVATALLRRRFR